MSDEFFRTRMGHTFYEGIMPRIADALERIAKAQKEANKLKKMEMIISLRTNVYPDTYENALLTFNEIGEMLKDE